MSDKNSGHLSGSERVKVRVPAQQLRNKYGGKGLRPEARRVFILGVVFLMSAAVFSILPTYMFSENALSEMTLSAFIDRVAGNLNGLVGVFTGNAGSFELRFMKGLICLVSGAALGLCGSAYQGAFNNPLAAPKTLGVMSGGALGALIYILFFQGLEPAMPSGQTVDNQLMIAWRATLSPWELFISDYGKCLCSIIGCFAIVGVVMFITSLVGRGKLSNITVVLAGQVFSVAITAIIQYFRYYFTMTGNEDLAAQVAEIEHYSMMGTYTYQDIFIVVLPIFVCICIVIALRGRLTLLSFGEAEARSMGVNVNATRYGLIVICTLMVGLSISFCGHVAFLGFISAHISRKIVGPDFRFLLPASALVGGSFMICIQWICDSGLPYTNPYAAAAVCSMLGACIFLVLAVREGRKGADAWSE